MSSLPRALAFVLLVLVQGTFARAEAQERPELEQAAALLEEGELDDALMLLDAMIGAGEFEHSANDLALAHFYRGRVRLAQGDALLARIDFARARELDEGLGQQIAALEAPTDAPAEATRVDPEPEAGADLVQAVATPAGRPGPGVESREIRAPPSPGQVLMLGVLVPGGGYFKVGSPVLGVLALAAVGGAIGVALQSERVEIFCAAPAQGGTCPDRAILGEDSEPLYQGAALGAAAGIWFLSALHARSQASGAFQGARLEAAPSGTGGWDLGLRVRW